MNTKKTYKMRIIKFTNPSFPEKDWFKCTIGNITHSSPIRKNVENWRDDRLKNHVYYKELAELQSQTLQEMYDNNHNNWTGD